MTLTDLNESLLLEWWAQDVAKSMKKKGTVGAFTQQCKDMGFQKSSYACINHVKKEYNKLKGSHDGLKAAYEAGDVSKKDYKEWSLKNKRANLAKTFKRWSKKKKSKTKEK